MLCREKKSTGHIVSESHILMHFQFQEKPYFACSCHKIDVIAFCLNAGEETGLSETSPILHQEASLWGLY